MTSYEFLDHMLIKGHDVDYLSNILEVSTDAIVSNRTLIDEKVEKRIFDIMDHLKEYS